MLLSVALLAMHSLVHACEANVACDKCAKDSGMSWNPAVVPDRLRRFYSLDDLVKAAYQANDFATATTLAKEYLDLAATYRCNWNYGNAIHDANGYLGLMSLKAGDRGAAAVYLIAAGKSSGSPQLNSFGPDLGLANELLKAGDVEPVKAYLKDIERFWSMDNGRVAEWLTSIEKGETPELNRFQPKLGITEGVLICLALAWPALVVAAVLFFRRRRLSRKWLFAIAGVVSGYLVMILTSWGSSYALAEIVAGMDTTNASWVMFAVYAVMAASFLFPFLAILGVSRLFVAGKVEVT
jgi:hypothetical protein